MVKYDITFEMIRQTLSTDAWRSFYYFYLFQLLRPLQLLKLIYKYNQLISLAKAIKILSSADLYTQDLFSIHTNLTLDFQEGKVLLIHSRL